MKEKVEEIKLELLLNKIESKMLKEILKNMVKFDEK
jgi:ribosomal protein L12E/L44/L45/RPP1/RPP2